ncbi:hypothetical protein [Cupriavidus sp. YAF13]|uniref:hypothetical protein n=1 Tax=Cupriavidus sp. YAF13 TaxID=3233075 RepID=UPI003F9159D8
MDFLNDLRRLVKRAIHPRLDVSIDEDLLHKSIPPEVLHDADKLREYPTLGLFRVQTFPWSDS